MLPLPAPMLAETYVLLPAFLAEISCLHRDLLDSRAAGRCPARPLVHWRLAMGRNLTFSSDRAYRYPGA
jgi:hypothetical protein